MTKLMFPKAAPEKPSTRMKRGANLVIVTKIEETKAANGHPKKNKNGDGGIDIKFETKEKAEFTETFWLADNTQWRLDAFLKAIGLDNRKGEISVDQALKKKLWLVLQEELHLENGKQKTKPDKNGKEWPVSFFKVLEFKEYIKDAEAPSYSDDKLVTHKEVGTSTGPAKAAASFDKPATESKTKEAVKEEEDWEAGGGEVDDSKGYPSDWDDTDANI